LRHGHGEALMPMVHRVMTEAALSPRDLDIVAAAIGPGGFTGIRVGLAAARGIALATGARLIGVSGFAAVAHALARAGRIGTGNRGTVLVALDSRREDLYLQLFALDDFAPLAQPRAVLPEQLCEYVGEGPASAPLLIAGDAADAAASALQGRIGFDVVPGSPPDAIGVVAAALQAARSAPPDPPVRPLYLRPPDVTLPKPRGIPAPARP
jgi:tRNA threonylcarbamoyladenosine biosynthesis protein TsaB